ncbi:MAG: glycosyltransferase family 2 protein, partial [Beduini sp.]
MDKIGIILLNYNAYEDTKECIESLKAMTYPNYEIFVVDNDSQDDSADRLKQIKDIHFIESGRNGGFGYGNNIGIKAAIKLGCQKILLLNNDTTVEPDFLAI